MLPIVLKKTFFKLVNNSAFGKTMENLRKRINIRPVNNVGDCKKYLSKPSFVSQKILNKSFVAIHKIKSVLTLDKPIYVGFSILDLSKLLMYEFHYKYIKTKYNAKLLFTDTGSLVYEIETKDVYEDFLEETTEKYKTFPLPIEKEVTNIDKDGNESAVTISYKIKFIDSATFIASSLSNLVDNLPEGNHKIKCKDCDCFLDVKVSRRIL